MFEPLLCQPDKHCPGITLCKRSARKPPSCTLGCCSNSSWVTSGLRLGIQKQTFSLLGAVASTTYYCRPNHAIIAVGDCWGTTHSAASKVQVRPRAGTTGCVHAVIIAGAAPRCNLPANTPSSTRQTGLPTLLLQEEVWLVGMATLLEYSRLQCTS